MALECGVETRETDIIMNYTYTACAKDDGMPHARLYPSISCCGFVAIMRRNCRDYLLLSITAASNWETDCIELI
jgi:hypothetical protein